MAAIEYRGLNAVTNFDISRYVKCLQNASSSKDDDNTMQNPNQEVELTTAAPSPDSAGGTTASSTDRDPPRSSFPDDIQTSFDFQDSSSFVEENDIMFGNYDSFMLPMFQ